MKTQVTYAFLATIILSFFTLSCEQDMPNVEKEVSQIQNRQDFAKLLAKAITNEEVRRIVKQEALKRFDNDTDVLFQLVKDKTLSSGETLENYIASFSSNSSGFKEMIKSDPLLTIYVPTLSNFTPETWDIRTQIPVVAVMDEVANDKKEAMLSYDEKGDVIELDYKVAPEFPTIVVKTNERLTKVETQLDKNARMDKESIVETDGGLFSFTYEAYNGTTHPKSTSSKTMVGGTVGNNVDPKLIESKDRDAACQRDYVYYNILNQQDRGSINTAYKEYISGFQVNSTASYDLIVDDWADGTLEFIVNFIFAQNNGNISNLSKGFSVAFDEIFKIENDVLEDTWYYHITPAIPIVTWDAQKYGDTWKMVVTEFDPGTEQTYTTSVSSTFGTNFSGGQKDGVGFGSTSTFVVSQSFQFKITGTSDLLQEGIQTFCEPLYIGSFPLFLGAPFHYIEDIDTGLVRVLIMPRTRAGLY